MSTNTIVSQPILTQNESSPSSSVSGPGIALFTLFFVLLLSLFSGYQAAEVPVAIRYQFSPLGLLLGFDRHYFEFESLSGFNGVLSFTFDYFFTFLKTCLLEAPFYYFVFRKRGFNTFLGVLFGANLLTHPFVFFVFPWLFKQYIAGLLYSEIFAPSIEVVVVLMVLGLCRNKEGVPSLSKCALAIVLANLFSWQVGVFWS